MHYADKVMLVNTRGEVIAETIDVSKYADRYVIEAAPELIEVLEELYYECASLKQLDPKVFRKLEKILAKAKGQLS